MTPEDIVGLRVSEFDLRIGQRMTLFFMGGVRLHADGALSGIDWDANWLVSGFPVSEASFTPGDTSVLSIDGVNFWWDGPVRLSVEAPE